MTSRQLFGSSRIFSIAVCVLVGLAATAAFATAATRSFSPHSVERSIGHFKPHGGKLRVHLHVALSHGLQAEPQPAPAPSPTPTPKPTPTPAPETPPAESKPDPQPPIAVEPNEPVSPPGSPTSEITIPANARYVSASSGNDSNSGSVAAPWRTLAKAISSVTPGDVVVLKPGTYGAFGTTTNFERSGSAGAPIVFTSDPGSERAVIHGYVRVTASHVRLDSLVFDGPTGPIVAKSSSNPGGEEVQVSIMYGTDVELSNSEVRESAWHAGVFVSQVTNARVVSNYVHDNGDVATGANLDHGIYWCSGSGTISNNLVEDNVAYGIQLYPNANNVIVSHNTITGSGKGGIIVGTEASGNQILNNLVANNALYGIRTYSLTGAGNVARENLLWKNGENISGSGIGFSGTVVQDPKVAGGSYGAQ